MLKILEPLNRVLEAGGWVGMDLETTGLSRDAEIVEVGLVAASGAEWSSLVRPEGPVSRAAERIHGLTAEDLAGAPELGAVAAPIVGALSGRVVLGYHIDFDRRLLWSALARAGRPAPRCRWICLCQLTTAVVGRRLTLETALRRFEIDSEPFGPAHRALPDARRIAALARRLVG